MMDLDRDKLFEYFKIAKNTAMITVEAIDDGVIDKHLPIITIQIASLLCLAVMKERRKSKSKLWGFSKVLLI